MKIHTVMPSALKKYFYSELFKSENAFSEGDYHSSWLYLERSHILGQSYPYEHSLVHWKMLLFGIKTKNTKEIIGQIPRLLIGGVKSFVGKIPVGNTGGANVPALQSKNIPEDLLNIINITSKETHHN